MTAPRRSPFLVLAGLACLLVACRGGQAQSERQRPAGTVHARPSERVITVPQVYLGPPATERIWVSCRVPDRARVRVQASDEGQDALEVFRAPRMVTAGQWAVWALPRDARWGETATLRLYVDPLDRKPQGAVFVVSSGARPTPAALNATYGRTDFKPNPARPPRDRTGEFTFGLNGDADVTFTIQPSGGASQSPLYERVLRDMPKGQHTVRWNLKTRERSWAPPGAYVARFGATSREGHQRMAHVVVYFTIAPRSQRTADAR